MEKIAIALIGENNEIFKTKIEILVKSLNVEFVFIEGKDGFEQSFKLGKTILSKKADRGIVIDNFGSLPFMVIGKMKGMVVAQISDEHSAHMTSEHNGSNVMVIGAHIAGIETIMNMICKYIKTPFAAGRHLVRTDMLDEMLKEEGDIK